MYKPIFAALIAATALATPALAQDRHGGWHGRDSNQGQSSSGDRGNRGSWRQSQQSAQPQAQQQPQQNRRQWNGGGQQQQQVQQQQPQQQQPQQYRRQWNGGQQQQQVQQQQPQQFRRQWNGGGGGQQAQGRGRGQWNGGQQAQGYRGNNSGYRSNGNRGNWSNGWRGDNRYDWRGYRNSNRNAFHLPRYYPPRGYGYGYQRFGIGYRLGALLFSSQYWIDDPWSYRLPDAYGEYRWVRYFNDALLVDIETGEVVDVEYDVFW